MGRFTLLPAQGRVMLEGQPVRLSGRAVDLLHTLVAHRGEVVAKDELLRSVWPGLVVEENNLHVQVSALRKLLGPGAIVTVAGRGYTLNPGLDVRDEPDRTSVNAGDRTEVLAPMRGRGNEAATLRKLVREHRIVTVAGPCGVGKSRLVREVLADHDDGPVRCIELANEGLGELRQAADAVQAQAQSQDRSAIVVIENAEQSIDDAGELADLLASAPGVRLVCTSQAPLNARGEHVLRLAPLPVPTPHAGSGMTPALEVMLDSVATLQPGFSLNDENSRDAAAICRHLDGLPLAITLAAGRIPLLGFAGVRRRMADRFHLLRGGPRGTAPRHQSLEAAMDWSWRFLSARERDALAALSRLKGRFRMHAATKALLQVGRDEWDAMQLLGALVDKSVVLADSPGQSSFRVLESMRLFASSRPPG